MKIFHVTSPQSINFTNVFFFFNFSIIWMLGRVSKWFKSWCTLVLTWRNLKIIRYQVLVQNSWPSLSESGIWVLIFFSLKGSWMILLGSLVRNLETRPVCSKPVEVLPHKEENLITWPWHSITIILIFWIMWRRKHNQQKYLLLRSQVE